MSTISDVAKAAGVSTATVSRVLSNSDTVKPETRALVLKTVKEMNYKPNALARQMRTQKTKTVIVIVPNIGNSFFSAILSGIEQAAQKYDYQILIADMHKQPFIEDYYLHAIQEHTIDGIISLSSSVAKNILEKIAKEYPLVIACQYLENFNVPNVTIDNLSAAKGITEHLINLGHTQIAHLTGAPTAALYRDRFNGYISALAAHNLPVDPELVKFGDATIMSGYNSMKELLSSSKDITAVFAAGDIMALGAITAIKEANLRVPEDIAVVGFDDIEISAFWDPALTTVKQPRHLIGETAFMKLYTLMNEEPLEDLQTVLDYQIIIRDSCGYKKKP